MRILNYNFKIYQKLILHEIAGEVLDRGKL